VEKSVFFKTYIHKSGVQPGDEFLYFSKIKITYGKAGITFFIMKLYQSLVFEQGDLYTLRGSINNKFLVQITAALCCQLPVKMPVVYLPLFGLLLLNSYTGLLWG
jgi:hypothetical protein